MSIGKEVQKMKKMTIFSVVATIVVSNASAYQLVTSVYTPLYKNDIITFDWEKAMAAESTETGYAKNYLDPTFVAGIANVFDREMASDNKVVRDAFSRRTLTAFLGFHKKAIEGESNFDDKISDMIDFIAMPMLLRQPNDNKETLDEYTTRLRKEAINKASGKVWAAGKEIVVIPVASYKYGYSSNSQPNTRYVSFPAKIEGVQYNSFRSEFLTILQEARKLGVEMQVLAKIENVVSWKDNEIKKSIKSFNEAHAGTDTAEHPLKQCYGYLDSQEKFMQDATIIKSKDTAKAEEFVNGIYKAHKEQTTPKIIQQGYYDNTNDRTAKETLSNPPVIKVKSFECMLPALKQKFPMAWANFEQDKLSEETPFWKKALLASVKVLKVIINNQCEYNPSSCVGTVFERGN